jgi:hypothetical protein
MSFLSSAPPTIPGREVPPAAKIMDWLFDPLRWHSPGATGEQLTAGAKQGCPSHHYEFSYARQTSAGIEERSSKLAIYSMHECYGRVGKLYFGFIDPHGFWQCQRFRNSFDKALGMSFVC